MLDILICPMCRCFPLRIYVFKETRLKYSTSALKKPFCSTYCGLVMKSIIDIGSSDTPCEECLSRDVVWGIVVCDKCGRWYPIIGGVVFMYPDDIRLNTRVRHVEKMFIEMFGDKIPKNVLSKDPLKLFTRYRSGRE